MRVGQLSQDLQGVGKEEGSGNTFTILATDKTHLDLSGRLQMEPITISQPIAMRILGYIDHTTPAHKRMPRANVKDFNAPTHLPLGTQYFEDALKPRKGMSWST